MRHPLPSISRSSVARSVVRRTGLLAAAVCLVSACAPAAAQPRPVSVVLAEVSDASEFPGVDVAGAAQAALVTALKDLKEIQLIPPPEAEAAVKELGLRFPLDDASLKQVAQRVQADLAVAARVLSCTHNEFANRATVRLRMSIYDPKADVAVRRTIVTGVSQTDDPRATVPDLVANALKEAAYRGGAELLRSTAVSGALMGALSRDTVLVNLTSAHGIRVGTEFAVFDGTEEVGRLVAVDVSAGRTVCRIKGDTPLERFVPGLRVVVVGTPEEPVSPEAISPPPHKSSGSKVLAVLAILLIGYFIVQEVQRQRRSAEGRGVSMATFQSPANNATLQAGQEVPVRVLFADANGNPVPDGTQVNFSLSEAQLTQQQTFLGTIQSPATTSGGVATSTYIAGTAGTAVQLTASVGRFSRSVIVRIGAGPAANVTIAAAAEELPANGVAQTQIRATVTDETGNPIQRQSVTFSTTAGRLSSTTVPTDADGEATTMLFAPTTAGVANVEASIGGITAMTSVTFTPLGVASISVEPGTTSVPAGTGETQVVATLLDANGNRVADGTRVDWSVSPTNLGTVNPTSGTTVAGTVLTTFAAGNSPGRAIVMARSGAAMGQAEISIASMTAAGVSLVAAPTSAPADGLSAIRLTATVVDSTGGAVADGTQVQFAVTSGTAQLSTPSVPTRNGKAEAQVTSQTVGRVQITATVTQGNQSAAVTVDFTPRTASAIQLTVGHTPIQIGDSGWASTTITGVVTDSTGRFVEDGTAVTVTTTLGTVSPGQTTTTGGQFTVEFRSIVTGTASVTATSGSATATATVVINSGGAAAIILSANPRAIRADGSSFATITARVVDRSGNNVVDGTLVTFSAQVRVAGSNTPEDATITPQAPTVGGVATAILVSRRLGTTQASSPGSTVVIARVLQAGQPPEVPAPEADIQNAIVEVQFVSQFVADVRLGVEPYNRRGLDIVGNEIAVTAQVADASNNPVPDGTAVYFTTSHGMIRGAAGSTAEGVALSFTANGVANAVLLTPGWLTGDPTFDGTVDITVTVGGPSDGSGTGGFRRIFTDACVFSGPAVLANSRIELDRATVAGVNDSLVVKVYAFDQNNQPVEDGTAVRIRASKGRLENEELTTVGGVVTTTLRTSSDPAAPTAPGAGTVQAFIATQTGPDLEPPAAAFTVN